jgi:hypothetical protein
LSKTCWEPSASNYQWTSIVVLGVAMQSALLSVDTQNDFIEGRDLPVTVGAEVAAGTSTFV